MLSLSLSLSLCVNPYVKAACGLAGLAGWPRAGLNKRESRKNFIKSKERYVC